MAKELARMDGESHEDSPQETKVETRSPLGRLFPAFLVVALVGLAGAGLIAPPAAAELNLSFVGTLFKTLFDALTSIIPSFETFIDAGFPLLIKIIIYVAIIGVIGLGLYFFREVIQKIVKMIGF